MAGWLVKELEDLLKKAKANPEVHKIEEDVKAIGHATVSYIEKNGLQQTYAIARSVLIGAATGTPWATVGAAVVSQATAAGISIAKGAEAIILAQAQADLIAIGTIPSPITGTAVV